MRTVVGTILIIAGIAAAGGWYLFDALSADAPRARATTRPAPDPPAQLRAAPAPRRGAAPPPAASHIEPTPPASQTESTSAVRWAAPPGHDRAAARLAAAQDTLAREPLHAAALRDAYLAHTALEQHDRAERALRALRRIEPNDVELHYEHGVALVRTRQVAAAIEAFEGVVAARPDHARAWFNLAAARHAAGRLRDARTAYDRAIDLAPSAAGRSQRGVLLLDLHEWAAAAADFDAVLAAAPDSTDAALNLATALDALGHADAAIERLAIVLTANPRHIPTLNRLAAMSWRRSARDETRRNLHLAAVREYCERSIALAADQPEIVELRDRAAGAKR